MSCDAMPSTNLRFCGFFSCFLSCFFSCFLQQVLYAPRHHRTELTTLQPVLLHPFQGVLRQAQSKTPCPSSAQFELFNRSNKNQHVKIMLFRVLIGRTIKNPPRKLLSSPLADLRLSLPPNIKKNTLDKVLKVHCIFE